MKMSVVIFGAWALCLGTAIAAQASSPPPSTPAKTPEVIMIKVIKPEGSAQGDPSDHAMKHAMSVADCKGGTQQFDSSDEVREGDKTLKRTRIVLCNKGDGKGGDVTARLTQAREALSGDTNLSAEAKAKVLASLDREIARLKEAPAK